jgi:hypothetical protein
MGIRRIPVNGFKCTMHWPDPVRPGGCKAVIGQRLKQSGMFWSEAGAQRAKAISYGDMAELS